MVIAAKQFIGLRVETKSGQKLGRVRDFEIDADTLEIKKFYVRPAGIVKGLTDGDLMIVRNQILAIDENKMTVLDLAGAELAKDAERKKQVVMESQPILTSAKE